MIERTLAPHLRRLAKKIPTLAITGPRQSGKTTLAKLAFPEKPYVTFEDHNTLDFAKRDPRGFLETYPKGAILDEVQRVPALFSALQVKIDERNKPGLFILTGSQQFLMNHNITQTLAGRISLQQLLPLSLLEVDSLKKGRPKSLESFLHKGSYPRIYNDRLDPLDWYPSYIHTYIERDVRAIKNIGDLGTFQKFVKMCAARTAQILNLSSLANDCGISHVTALSWINIMEASYIVFRLKPYHRNYGKRLIKSPKLYFYDTGILCSLLDIQRETDLATHALRGAIFETFVISDLLKQRLHSARQPNIFYWRDKIGNEIDCILEEGSNQIPVEIKSGQTIADDWFRSMHLWKTWSHNSITPFLIYAGSQNQKRNDVDIRSWAQIAKLNQPRV